MYKIANSLGKAIIHLIRIILAECLKYLNCVISSQRGLKNYLLFYIFQYLLDIYLVYGSGITDQIGEIFHFSKMIYLG